jgi:hypothetical protein
MRARAFIGIVSQRPLGFEAAGFGYADFAGLRERFQSIYSTGSGTSAFSALRYTSGAQDSTGFGSGSFTPYSLRLGTSYGTGTGNFLSPASALRLGDGTSLGFGSASSAATIFVTGQAYSTGTGWSTAAALRYADGEALSTGTGDGAYAATRTRYGEGDATGNGSGSSSGVRSIAVFSTQEDANGTNGTNPNNGTYTWSNAAVGATGTDRYVLVTFAALSNKGINNVTVTIGGNTATVAYSQDANDYVVGEAYFNLTTGTGVDIVFSTVGGGTRWSDIHATTYRLEGFNMTPEDTYTATGTTVSDTAFSTSADSRIFGVYISDAGALSWTNLTEVEEVALTSTDAASAYDFTGSRGTITVTATTSGGVNGYGRFISLAPSS